MPTTANRLRALIAGATKGPLAPVRNDQDSGDIHYDVAGGDSQDAFCTAVSSRSKADARLIVALANIREELAEWAESHEMQRSALGYGENCARADAALLAALARELPEEKP